MNKDEFCKLTGLKYESITSGTWDVINTVYAYHPIISNINGKKEIADLYKRGGFGIIQDMYKTAKELAEAESRVQQNTVIMENLLADQKKEMDRLKQDHLDAVQDIKSDTFGANEVIADINSRFKA